MDKEFTIIGESLEALEYAAERVEAYMDEKIGNNVIHYQIMGELRRMPWDSGYITDEALKELNMGFIVVEDRPNQYA